MAGSHRKSICLIHWVHEQKWDVWPVEDVPTELRFEGALGMITYTNGQNYLGRILKISTSKKEIEGAERKLHEEILKSKDKPSEPTQGERNHHEKITFSWGKRKPSRSTKVVGRAATTKEVNKALGERLQLSTPEKLAKKKASINAKAISNAQLIVEAKEDEELFKGVSRDLFNSKPSSSSSKKAHDVISDDDEISSDDDIQHDNELTHPDDNDDMNDIIETQDASLSENDEKESDPHIHEFRNPNTEAFLQFLLEQFRTKGRISSSRSTPTTNKVYAKPLEVPGQKMVRLYKNHNLRISKGAKNVLDLDTTSQKSATNFVRKTLTHLYGKDQLMEMTAMGRKKDKLSISPSDLNTIYSYVTSICQTPLPWNAFTRVVMKKCSATKSPNTKSKSESRDKPKATPKSASDTEITVVASPAKFQATTIVKALETPPLKLPSPAKHSMSSLRGLLSPMKAVSASTPPLPRIASPKKLPLGLPPLKPTGDSEQTPQGGTYGSWNMNNQWQGSQWGGWNGNGSQCNAWQGEGGGPAGAWNWQRQPDQQQQGHQTHQGQYDPSFSGSAPYPNWNPAGGPVYTPL